MKLRLVGYTQETYYVQDRVGNIIVAHETALDAFNHAQKCEGLCAMVSRTVVKPILRKPRD